MIVSLEKNRSSRTSKNSNANGNIQIQQRYQHGQAYDRADGAQHGSNAEVGQPFAVPNDDEDPRACQQRDDRAARERQHETGQQYRQHREA